MQASTSPSIRRYAQKAPTLGWPVVIWATSATIVVAFVSLIAIAPLALGQGHDSSAHILYEMFGRVCHQNSDRAFFVAGYPLAVCARCTGIYLGFALGFIVYPLVRSLRRVDAPERKWLIWAAIPALLDFSLGFLGILENSHLSRSATGALLGVAAAFYVVPGLVDLSLMASRRAAVTLESVNER